MAIKYAPKDGVGLTSEPHPQERGKMRGRRIHKASLETTEFDTDSVQTGGLKIQRIRYLAGETASAQKPWKFEGISRSTWYRRKKELGERAPNPRTP